MERKKRDWGSTAALLCALLLAVNLWQGKRLENLERRISEAQMKLSFEIGELESSLYAQAQEEEKLVWNWEYTPSLKYGKTLPGCGGFRHIEGMAGGYRRGTFLVC